MATRTLGDKTELYQFDSSLGNTLELPESTNLVEGFVATIANVVNDSTSVTIQANSASALDKIMHPTTRTSWLSTQVLGAMPLTAYAWVFIKTGQPVSTPLWYCIIPNS